MELNLYLEHIRVKPIPDRLLLLRQIHRNHLLQVPFENLDIHWKKPLSMNPDHVFQKVVHHKRGGLCYKVNILLYRVLTQLQYNISLISACFWDEEKEDWNPEFSHLALLVELDGTSYLFDVGIGCGFVEPLPIAIGQTFSDESGVYQFKKEKEHYILQKQFKNQWTPLLSFTTTPRQPEDFYEQFLDCQTNPQSMFTQKRICSKLTPDGRVSLSDDYLTITVEGQKKKIPILSEEDWNNKLYKYFGIAVV